MISQVNSLAVQNAYSSNLGESKTGSKRAGTSVSSQGDMSRIEKIKQSVDAGSYKIDLQVLSEKIADELM